MKKTALLIAALAVGAGSLRAQDSSYSLTVDFPFVSKYVFRGIQLADESIQPSVEFASGDFYAGIWSSQPFTNNIDNEFDFYAGYGVALNETWSLDFGATYYLYPETPSTVFEDQFEPFVGIAGDIGGFSTAFYLYYETQYELLTYQGSLGYSIPLSDAVSFDLAASLGFVDAPGNESYTYWDFGASFSYAINETASAYAGVTYASNDIGFADDDFFWVTTGLTISF